MPICQQMNEVSALDKAMQRPEKIAVTGNGYATWNLAATRFSDIDNQTFIVGLLCQVTLPLAELNGEPAIGRRIGPHNSTLVRDMGFEILSLPQLKHQQHRQIMRRILFSREVAGPETLNGFRMKQAPLPRTWAE